MKKIVLVFASIVILFFVNIVSAESLQKYTLESFPKPVELKLVNSKVDIVQHNICKQFVNYSIPSLSNIDPFYFDRKQGMSGPYGGVPEYSFLQFSTSMHPRDVSHFYKDLFFDGVVVKSSIHKDVDDENSNSSIFSQNNEVIFYTISMNSNGVYYIVSAFQENTHKPTEVYIFNFEN